MPFGYNRKILSVNLTDEHLMTLEPSEILYRSYLGGMGLIAYYLVKEMSGGEDPLGPANMLVFASGVVTGAPLSGSGRNAVGAKSPLTGGFGEADVGGFWGAELKHAGFDAILFKGEAERPLWLWIEDGKAELNDASSLWGLEVAECQKRMRIETGQPLAKTALIGPGGENLVRSACIINDLNHVAGRCGLGAVMGAKKLKGISIIGHNKLEMADPEKVRQLAKTILSRIPTQSKNFQEYGTGAAMDAGVVTGNLPTRNFRDGEFKHASEIDAIAIKNKYRIGMESCYACAVRCKKIVELNEPYIVKSYYGGPEYETLAAFGSNCGISDLTAICKANELCQRYGLDTISVGCIIAFAMECYENNIITKEMTGGIDLSFGNTKAMLQLVEKIAKREGIGNILAEGTKRAAMKLGKESEDYAIHVKGQEIPMHEPRLKQGLGLGYAVSPTGADHCHNIHDTFMSQRNYEKLRPFGILEEVPINSLNGPKVRLYKYWMEMRILANCLSICQFPPWNFIEYVDLVRAVTGWDVTIYELAKVAQRTLNLARIFNIREGFTKNDDWLPKRFFKPQTSGALSEVALNPDDLRNAINLYYDMMGWDNHGVPKTGTLHELGLSWTITTYESA